MANVRAWIEAMRLHTLPVSIAGVLAGGGCALYYNSFKWLPFLICLLFAIGAQIVSNFANEYFDYKNGLDKKGREGFRRGVTEGDISPTSLRNATYGLLVFTCALGCTLIIWGGWWLIGVGIAIALFALGYSTGPYPLSHHGWGEIAVIAFFGIVPVMLTCWLQTGNRESAQISFWISLAIGVMGSNVLILNNYRDADDDASVGKLTLAVRWGAAAMERLYIINGFIALACIEIATALRIDVMWQIGALLYINIHYLLWTEMRQSEGSELNALLGKTAMLMLAVAIWLLLAFAFSAPKI